MMSASAPRMATSIHDDQPSGRTWDGACNSSHSPRIVAPPPVRFLGHDLPVVLPLPMHEQQQESGDSEEDAIHDAEREARLPHRAFLVGVQAHGGGIAVDAVVVDGDGEAVVGGEVGAVGVGDVAELVDAGDEGADETEVDEGDEDGGVAGRFAAEDGKDGPRGGEDGNDEENAAMPLSVSQSIIHGMDVFGKRRRGRGGIEVD